MASSISDWLFGSTTNPKANSTSVVSQGQPEWWLETVKNLIGKSSAIAAEPYQAYTGQRIAAPAQDTTNAYDLTRQGIGTWKPSMDTATNTLSGIATGNADNVMDMIARRGQRNLSENLLPAVQDTFIGSGQFGGGRMNEFSGRALRDTNQSILDAQAGAFLQNQGQQASAAQGLGALSQQGQTQGLKDAAALQSIGGEQQAQQQKSLDTAYNQFLEERNAPRDTAQFMSQIIRGYNPPTTTSTSTDQVASNAQMGASPLAQLAGAGIGAYGISQAFKAKGGAVRKVPHYADGGQVDMRSGGAVPRGIGHYAKGGWIKGAVKEKGALHRDLGVPQGKKIPTAKISAAAKAPGKLGQRARFAQTMAGIGHKKEAA